MFHESARKTKGRNEGEKTSVNTMGRVKEMTDITRLKGDTQTESGTQIEFEWR